MQSFTDEERQKMTELLESGLLILFAISTLTREMLTLGGLTLLGQEKGMQVGESIIFSFRIE